jgi:hypothetical protein
MEKENVTLEELQKLELTSEKMARNIRMLSRAYKKLSSSGLREETIVLLLHGYSKVPKPQVRSVLSALRNLEICYTTPEKEEK